MNPAAQVLPGLIDAFHAQKALAERAITQVSDEDLRRPLDQNTNSIAVIMKHVGGNLQSRFTDFLTSDGEKPWRDRDGEFVDSFNSREEIMACWEAGWNCLFNALESLNAEHLSWEVMIRAEPHSVPKALGRALAHVGYHAGQIVLTARLLNKDNWKTITIARGGTRAFNERMGYEPEQQA